MKLLRWQEMPDFDIYSDQLITIVNQQLAFCGQEVTNSMINNYVKQKVMPLPVKKKYHKLHISRLIIISLLKSAYSLEEINQYINLYPNEIDYDCFCNHFEQLWNQTENGISCGGNPSSVTITELLITTVISKYKAIELLAKGEPNHATTTP